MWLAWQVAAKWYSWAELVYLASKVTGGGGGSGGQGGIGLSWTRSEHQGGLGRTRL
jgi:hypothetical protein